MTDQELKDLVAGLAVAQAETDRQIRALRKEIGAIGEKFGSFTEGMAFPTLRSILEDHFHMEVVSIRVFAHHGDDSLEIDVLGHANSEINAVCAVEVKSRLRMRDIRRLESKLNDFSRFFPEHHGKKLYGLVAAVDATPEQHEEVLGRGLYFARMHDDAFQLDVPSDFEPRAFQI